MDTLKSKATGASEKALKNNTSIDDVVAQPRRISRRIVQNFLVIWLDENFNEDDPNIKTSLEELRRTVASINTFADAEECFDFVSEIEQEKVFMILSDTFGQWLIPLIELWPQLASIYILCENPSIHKPWAGKIQKFKGIHTDIESICKALSKEVVSYDRAMIPISFQGIDSLFMYTQLLKEALLQITDDDEKAVKDFVDYCRQEDCMSPIIINQFEREYRSHPAIWWYTYPSSLYSLLNHGLRIMDTDIIIKTGFFIRHLHQNIEELYRKQHQSQETEARQQFTVYRGQGLPKEVFERLKQSEGGLMSFNNFLSTSEDRILSLESFARPTADAGTDLVGILFVMIVDIDVCETSNVPFADVSEAGYYEGDKSEILFTTHTIFRINNIRELPNEHTGRLWEVELTLTGKHDNQLNSLTTELQSEIHGTGWARLGHILMKLGEPGKAEQLHKTLLEQACTDEDRANYLHMLGWLYNDIGEYSKAVSHYERSLEINKKILPPNDLDFAASHNNIALVYSDMGEYSKALTLHQVALEIQQIALPPNHPNLAISYGNIGNVYSNMGDYSKALIAHQKALEIQKIALLPNHPDLAGSYGNIGNLYSDMGEHSNALSSHEQALEIRKTALPPNHPDLANSYMGIGDVYYNMGKHLKALSSYQQALEIQKTALSPNHPNSANCYSSIGSIYCKMNEYSKALSSHQQALEIRKIALRPNHPDLANSYMGIGNVYYTLGDYSKALASYRQALEIQKIVLPPNHPDLPKCYNNIGSVYYSMGDYAKALSSYQQTLAIKEIVLPPKHASLASCYNNIGSAYYSIGEYSKALASYQRAVKIQKIALPANHPDLLISYNNIGEAYYRLGDYSKALSIHKQTLAVRETALSSFHPDLADSYNNLGLVYNKLGDHFRALLCHNHAIEIREKALSTDHVDLATCYNDIAEVYTNMEEYSKSLSFNERGLDIRKRKLPPDHPEIGKSYNGIASMFDKKGDYSEALACYKKAEQIWQKTLPPNHPDVKEVKTNIESIESKM